MVKIDAKKCDRCGKFYIFGNEINSINRAIMDEMSQSNKFTINQYPDLCDDCQKQLNTLLNEFFHIRELPPDPLRW